MLEDAVDETAQDAGVSFHLLVDHVISYSLNSCN